jgi:hypothetical protein
MLHAAYACWVLLSGPSACESSFDRLVIEYAHWEPSVNCFHSIMNTGFFTPQLKLEMDLSDPVTPTAQAHTRSTPWFGACARALPLLPLPAPRHTARPSALAEAHGQVAQD